MSSVHAEIFVKGGQYVLKDLASANGTLHNNKSVNGSVLLRSGDVIRIGGTELTFNDRDHKPHTSSPIEASSTAKGDTASDLELDDPTDQFLRNAPDSDRLEATQSPPSLSTAKQPPDLLGFITRVGITLLDASTLDDILEELSILVLEAVPADRCMIMLIDMDSRKLKVRAVRPRPYSNNQEEANVVPLIAEEVVSRRRAIARDDVRNNSLPSVAVPLQGSGSVFGVIFAEATEQEVRFDEGHVKILTTLASVAAIRIDALLTGLEKEREDGRADYGSYLASTSSEVERFLAAAGFRLTRIDESSFLSTPSISLWKKKIEATVYTRIHVSRALSGRDVLAISECAQKQSGDSSEAPKHAFVIVDKPVEDSAWLQIAALRSIRFSVIPIPITLISGNAANDSFRQGLALANHLERFIGQKIDPYDIRDPVSDVLNFFGREALARTLVDRLASGRAIGLFGLRKMGKSSLLNYMQAMMPYPTARLDLQAGVTLTGVFERVLRLWNNDAQARFGIDLGLRNILLNERHTIAEFAKLSQDALNRLSRRSPEARLALFLDEIELVTPPPHATAHDLEFYLSLMRALRGLVQEHGQFALMFAGVDASVNRINRWGKEQNPLYQLVQEVYLPPLLESDCIQMIRNIGQQVELTFSDEGGNFVAYASGGHPFLARQLCSLAFTQQKQRTGEMHLEYLQRAAERFIFDPQYAVYLNHSGLWNEATHIDLWNSIQSQINESILTKLASSPEPLPESALIAGSESYAKQAALFSLTQLHIIHSIDNQAGETEPRFAITFGLFRSWLRRSILGLTE